MRSQSSESGAELRGGEGGPVYPRAVEVPLGYQNYVGVAVYRSNGLSERVYD